MGDAPAVDCTPVSYCLVITIGGGVAGAGLGLFARRAFNVAEEIGDYIGDRLIYFEIAPNSDGTVRNHRLT